MPSPTKTTRSLRSRSPGRPRSPGRSRSPGRKASPSRKTRSRSRSRGRSKSPARSKPKSSPSPTRVSKKREEKKTAEVPPVRQSARIAAIQESKKDEVDGKTTEIKKTTITKTVTEQTVQSSAPAKAQYEFGGPIGTFLTMLILPHLVLALNLVCNKKSCDIRQLPAVVQAQHNNLGAMFSSEAATIVVGWILFQAILSVLPVGREVEGQPLAGTGKRLKYRLNGFISMVVTMVAFAGLVYRGIPVSKVNDLFIQLAFTSIIFSTILAAYLFVKARHADRKELAPGGNTGNVIYDFFMGRELNPRVGLLDLKFFCELRPGLIGWMVLNVIFVLQKQNPSTELLFVAAAQGLYVADALWFEEAILTTMDITTEGFGWMLTFGDLAWVPFMYGLQTRYLMFHPLNLPMYKTAGLVLLFLTGYVIFRGSNSQKDQFRKNPFDPSLAHLESIPTPAGKRLLVSGWWGLCRHPNYLGDLVMALSWSLACGFGSIVPYFYPVYFFILLAHRQRRDEAHCRAKYGAAWDRYVQRVPYRIIPYIY